MKNKLFNNKSKLIILIILLIILIFSFISLVIINFTSLKKYDDVILNNIYVDEFDLSDYDYKSAKSKLEFYEDYLLNKDIVFKINNKEYKYKLKDLGMKVDTDKTLDSIKKYQSKLSISKKNYIKKYGKKKVFNVYYKVDDSNINTLIDTLKKNVNVSVVNGYFDASDGVKYVAGVDGFTLNEALAKEKISDYFVNAVDKDIVIELTGDVVNSTANEAYKTIDTMTSSFMTKFNVWEGTRPTNLRVALNYINGAIVEPGEIFSYYKYAGPYDKKGYVFYYQFVGNGVCQIATTVYNAALVGGLQIVKRYPHAKKSVYVEGGLDATVASYSSGWNVDFQFKNTYKYPIYIKAYAVGGEAHVEFWSNSNAKEGKTYETESVSLGGRGYKTYLRTYKDGKMIDRSLIDTTWYTED